MSLPVPASPRGLLRRVLRSRGPWIFAAWLATTASAQRVNLAKYQTVAASSQNTSYVADFATDGIVSNFHSLRTSNITNNFFTLEVGYPRPVTLASAHLYTGLLESASAAATQVLPSYRYQYFDGAAWVTITSVLNNTAPEVASVFPQAVTASRFRLLGISNGSFAIRELAFFPPNLVGGIEQGYPLGTDVTLNLAYQRPSAASSAQLTNANGPGHARNAFDGHLDSRSRWLTLPVNGVYSAGETLEVDLLSVHAVATAHVYSGIMDANRVSGSPIPDFSLQAWDAAASAWVAIPGAAVTGNTQTARLVEFASPVSTSKIRLVTTGPTPARLQELLLFPPRAGGTPLGREVLDAAPPTDPWERYSDSFHRLRNAGPDLRLGLVGGSIVNVAADAAFPQRTEWQLLLNYRDGTYRVRNAESGLCLALAQLSTASGIGLVAEDYTALPHQDWRLVYSPTTPTQFALVNAYSGLALQPQNSSWSAGTPLVVVPYVSGLNLQHWTSSLRRAHPKKGVAATTALIGARYTAAPGLTYHQDYYNRLDGAWSYGWGRQTGGSFPYLDFNHAYNPMQWGNGAWNHGNGSAIPIERNHRDLQATGKPVYLLGFNEPDQADQANMSVDDAIRRWPRLLARDVPVVSPAPASTYGNTWFEEFVTKADALGYRRDYTATHWYSAPSSDALVNHLTAVYNDYGRPVWLTEFGNTRWSGTATWTEAQSYNFLAEFLWRAEALTWLKRYSIFGYIEEAPGAPPPASPDPPEAPRSNILRHDGTLTPLGQLYAGWDGVTSIVGNRAYHLHNHGEYERVSNAASGSAPSLVGPDAAGPGLQWFFSPGVAANTWRILSTRDGRPLRAADAATVEFGAAGQTDSSVEWRTVAESNGHGRHFIEHPATNTRLRAHPNATLGLAALTSTGDAFKWRLVRPAVSDPVGAPATPAGLLATASTGSITLAWSAVTGPSVTYAVERASSASGPWTTVATGLTPAGWTDPGLPASATYFYRVAATNLYALASAPSEAASATTPPADLYAAWNAGIAWNDADSSPTADPDRDGLQNLLEYALSANPLASTPAPSVRIAAGLPSRLALDFARVADPALTYTVEASDDLAAWTPVWTSTGAQNLAGPVAVADPADLASHSRRFLRLKVSLR